MDLDAARRQSRKVPDAKLVRKGDVLINSTGEGTLGRVAQVQHEIANCTVDSHVTIARPKAGLSPIYFGLSLKQREPYISGLGRGATNQTELSRDSIAQLRFLCPPKELLEEFETHENSIEAITNVLTAHISQLKQARDLVLPRLMNGEVEV